MKVRELVGFAKAQLTTVTKIHPDPFIQKEAEDSLEEFKKILSSLENSNFPVNEQSVKPLLDFFKKRWEFICGFDAIPMHNPHTPINQLTWTIGLELSALLDKDVYSIICPTIKTVRNDPTLANAGYPKPSELVVSDKDDAAIEVYFSIGRSAKENGVLKHTIVLDGVRKNLTASEANRVMHYSQQAEDLYKKAEDVVDWDFDPKNVRRARQSAHKYTNSIVTATYGPKAHACFAYKLISSRDQLAAFLAKQSLENWPQILDTFDTQDLRTIILNGVNFDNVVVNKDIYTTDEMHNRAILMMFLHLLRCEYKNSVKPHVGSTWGWDVNTKNTDSNIPYDYLLSGKPLDGFSTYVANTKHTNALTQQRLGVLTNQISMVAEYSKLDLSLTPEKAHRSMP